MISLVLVNIALALFLAFIVEVLIEHFIAKPLEHAAPFLDRWWLIYVALVFGGLVSWFCKLNIFAELEIPELVGLLLTAVLVGGGAPLIHSVVNKARDPLGELD